MAVCSLSLHLGSSESRKTPEQKFIFQIGTLSPHCINERFSFFCFLVTIFPPIVQLHFLHINPHTTHNSSNRSDEGLTLATSAFFNSLRWPIYVLNSVVILNYPVIIISFDSYKGKDSFKVVLMTLPVW